MHLCLQPLPCPEQAKRAGHGMMEATAEASPSVAACPESHLAMLQAHDLLDVLNLRVVDDLGQVGLPHVQQLAPADRSRQIYVHATRPG